MEKPNNVLKPESQLRMILESMRIKPDRLVAFLKRAVEHERLMLPDTKVGTPYSEVCILLDHEFEIINSELFIMVLEKALRYTNAVYKGTCLDDPSYFNPSNN